MIYLPRLPHLTQCLLLVLVAGVCLSGCGDLSSAAPAPVQGRVFSVLAGENFWGSIAQQLGGRHVRMRSVVSDPNADPHEYQSTISTAREFAAASYVILNGAGYDSWAQRELDAASVPGRKVLVVADRLHKTAGDNPHFWYDPPAVMEVAARITRDYQDIDPQDARYFARQYTAFQRALVPYHQEIARLRVRYGGHPVGATESIFVYLAAALSLDLISPPPFMQAISEGNDPPISSVVRMETQIKNREIQVLVYNMQTATQITTTVKDLAAQAHIPTVGVTETMPSNTYFQRWQVTQLKALGRALAASQQR